MTLNVNGVAIEHVNVNGSPLDIVNADGTEVWSGSVVPGRVGNLRATTNLVNKITFTWTPTPIGKPTPTYDLYRLAAKIATNIKSGHQYTTTTHSNVAFHLKAVNSAGSTDSNTVNGKAVQPPPKGLWARSTIAIRGPDLPGMGGILTMQDTHKLTGNGHNLTLSALAGSGFSKIMNITGAVRYNASTKGFIGDSSYAFGVVTTGGVVLRGDATGLRYMPGVRAPGAGFVSVGSGKVSWNHTTKRFSGTTFIAKNQAIRGVGAGIQIGGWTGTTWKWSSTLPFS